MSELQGIGPKFTTPPVGAPRPLEARKPAEASAPISFGQDAAEVNFAQAPVAETAAPAAEAPTAPQAKVERPEYQAQYDPATGTISFTTAGPRPQAEEYDGFLVAHEAAHSNILSPSETPLLSGTGPIAMIEDPQPVSTIEFPGLDLNGPSTAHEGFYGLSGRRLA